jgi:transposase
VVEERSFRHSGEGLAQLSDWLFRLAADEPDRVWVAIELPHGAVVETLLERGFRVHAINPKQLDRFRDRFTVAGAKDDRRDAYVLADSLRTDAHCFRRLKVDAPLVIELREWSRMTEDLQQEHVRLTNRVREQLRRYYPQALEITHDVGEDWFLELWEAVPSPARATIARESTLSRILRANRIRKIDGRKALELLRARPVIVAVGTVDAATAHIRLVAARLRVVNEQLRQCYRRLDDLTTAICQANESKDPAGGGDQRQPEQSDGAILRSCPGVGRIVLATLLAEASQPLRERDYQTLRALSGVAPVTRRSGKRCSVVMRMGCHPRLRGALYHWSRVATQVDPPSREAYTRLRQAGKTHGRALRGVGDRLLGVACAMLRVGTRYDPSKRGTKRAPCTAPGSPVSSSASPCSGAPGVTAPGNGA